MILVSKAGARRSPKAPIHSDGSIAVFDRSHLPGGTYWGCIKYIYGLVALGCTNRLISSAGFPTDPICPTTVPSGEPHGKRNDFSDYEVLGRRLMELVDEKYEGASTCSKGLPGYFWV